MAHNERLHFVTSDTLKASEMYQKLIQENGQYSSEEADVIVVLGGDGLMLETLHRFLPLQKPFYGIHSGTIGFLMNECPRNLRKNLQEAQITNICLLKMTVETVAGDTIEAWAINEISLLRSSRQAAKIELKVNGTIRLPEIICDGLLVATPAGSTAYNLSVGGAILPLGSPLLALTPISPFRPRRWRGAILPENIHMTWRALEEDKRPVSVVADHVEVRDVKTVEIVQEPSVFLTLLFDPHHNLESRILNEQFAF